MGHWEVRRQQRVQEEAAQGEGRCGQSLGHMHQYLGFRVVRATDKSGGILKGEQMSL